MRHQGFSILGLACAGLYLTGCAMSASSDSSLDILSSPFESSSASSGGDDSAYLGDVETLVLAYLEQPASPESFLRELTRVAADHGITDWEGDRHTTRAIGGGLRRGGASSAAVESFIARYLGELPDAAAQIRQGYEAAPTA